MSPDPDEVRGQILDAWEAAAPGWRAGADEVRAQGMAVSLALLDALNLEPALLVLELAAGPGDTGFLALERIRPGGRLISSDGTEAMLEVARARAKAAGLGEDAIEFRQLNLEWIDLPAASVDRVLCRWGIMLVVDPAAAAREIRRVLRPGGRAALAVWDVAAANPWATISSRALVETGHLPPPEPGDPGPFALGGEGVLGALLEDAGFTGVAVTPVAADRGFDSLEHYIAATMQCSPSFSRVFPSLSEDEGARVRARISELAQPYMAAGGRVRLPGRSLVAVGEA